MWFWCYWGRSARRRAPIHCERIVSLGLDIPAKFWGDRSRRRRQMAIRMRGWVGGEVGARASSLRRPGGPSLRCVGLLSLSPRYVHIRACCCACGASPSNLFEVEVEVSRLNPFTPLFLCLVEILWHFQKLDNLGLWVRPSPQYVVPVTLQETPNDHNWVGHLACRLRQVCTLSFMQAWCRLLPGDIVCPHLLSLNSVTSFF